MLAVLGRTPQLDMVGLLVAGTQLFDEPGLETLDAVPLQALVQMQRIRQGVGGGVELEEADPAV